MSSETLPDGTFVVRENGAALRAVLGAMGALALLAWLSAHLGVASVRFSESLLPPWAGASLAAGMCFLGALAVPSGEVRFCRDTRRVSWTRTQWGRTASGASEFADVLEVESRRFGDTEGDSYCVALRLPRESVPLLSTSNEAEAITLAQAVRGALQF